MKAPTFKYKRNVAFAEFAEALRCNTSDVLAVYADADDGTVRVVFTTGTDDLETARCYVADLARGADAVLGVTACHEVDASFLKDVLR